LAGTDKDRATTASPYRRARDKRLSAEKCVAGTSRQRTQPDQAEERGAFLANDRQRTSIPGIDVASLQ
jgi:hypothetical protein